MAYVNYGGTTLKESADSTIFRTGTSAGSETLTGTSANEDFKGGYGSGDMLVGKGGDDVYWIQQGDEKVVENSGEGTDTVQVWAKYQLPNNVENLFSNYDKNYAFGNNLNNIVVGTDGQQTIWGGSAGQDVLVSTGGADIFLVRKGEGNDVIYGFNSDDVIRLGDSAFRSFDQVKAAMTQVGADVRINLGGSDQLLVRDYSIGQFTAANFGLAVDTSKLIQTFNDDFNSFRIWNEDGGIWRTDLAWDGRWGRASRNLEPGHEQQAYTDQFFHGTDGKLNSNPFSIQNGSLNIHAQEVSADVSSSIWGLKYTSGVITTKESFAQLYGYFEMRVNVPAVGGTWPAFWLLPTNGTSVPEADVFEIVGWDKNTVLQTYHTAESGTKVMSVAEGFAAPTTDGYHTYGLLWTADTLTWYVDGAPTRTVATPDDMHQPMHMVADLAIGSDWFPDPQPGLSADMKIDYIRAYALPEASTQGLVKSGGSGADNLSGTAGGDTLSGNGGADSISGLAGGDSLSGGTGADTLEGGAGDDTLSGGGSGDVFVFQPGFGHDRITDFSTSSSGEVMRFVGFGAERPTIYDLGSDTLVRFDSGDQVILVGVDPGQLTANDWVWA